MSLMNLLNLAFRRASDISAPLIPSSIQPLPKEVNAFCSCCRSLPILSSTV